MGVVSVVAGYLGEGSEWLSLSVNLSCEHGLAFCGLINVRDLRWLWHKIQLENSISHKNAALSSFCEKLFICVVLVASGRFRHRRSRQSVEIRKAWEG